MTETDKYIKDDIISLNNNTLYDTLNKLPKDRRQKVLDEVTHQVKEYNDYLEKKDKVVMSLNEIIIETHKTINTLPNGWRTIYQKLADLVKDVLEGEEIEIYIQPGRIHTFNAKEVKETFFRHENRLFWYSSTNYDEITKNMNIIGIEINLVMKKIFCWKGTLTTQLKSLKSEECSIIEYEDNIGLTDYIISNIQ